MFIYLFIYLFFNQISINSFYQIFQNYVVRGGTPRTKATIKRLGIYNTKPVRDRDGKVVSVAFGSKEAPTVARIAPNRRWFGNTRTISQDELTKFRTDLTKAMHDPYTIVMRQRKLPMSLLNQGGKDPNQQNEAGENKMNLLEVETFEDTFGKKGKRKKPKLQQSSVDDMADSVERAQEDYQEEKDRNLHKELEFKPERRKEIFDKGKSKRIWNELYKVIDSSDILVQVLDARDPMGTRSKHLEEMLRKDRPHKHLIFVLNKCDLVPTWATARWVRILSKDYPTLAFHASLTNPFGKGSLIQLLRQFAQLHADKPQITVGFIGYPNVGKSSVINTLRSKKVCSVAPIPGETKVWQYITLMKRIYLVDCPGVVQPDASDTESEIVLKGVVRVEKVESAQDYIPELLKRVKKDYIERLYGISEWRDHLDFLEQFAQKTGRLLKKGEADIDTCAKMILHDWQRGRIPFFMSPPFEDENPNAIKNAASTTTTTTTTTTTSTIKIGKDGVKESDGSDMGQLQTTKPTKKSTEEGDSTVPLVQTKELPKIPQLFNKIRVTMEFDTEDMNKPLDEEDQDSDNEEISQDEEEEEEKPTKQGKNNKKNNNNKKAKSTTTTATTPNKKDKKNASKKQEEEVIDWDDVYKSVQTGEGVDDDDVENSLTLNKMEKNSKKVKAELKKKQQKQKQQQQSKQQPKQQQQEVEEDEEEEKPVQPKIESSGHKRKRLHEEQAEIMDRVREEEGEEDAPVLEIDRTDVDYAAKINHTGNEGERKPKRDRKKKTARKDKRQGDPGAPEPKQKKHKRY